MKIKILLLSANPKNTNILRVAEEFRGIKESISRSKYRNRFEIIQGEAIRAQDLRRLVLDTSPHFIHFSGHAENEGIFLEDDQGYSRLVKGDALEDLFSLFDSIYCVILNACYSKSQAVFLRNVVPYVIGMNESIEDKDAIYFSIGFYDGIAANRLIEDAFKFGVNSIKLRANKVFSKKRSLEVDSDEEFKKYIPVLLKGKIHRDLPSIDDELIKKNNVISNNKTQIIIAVLTLVGVLATAIFSNLDKISEFFIKKSGIYKIKVVEKNIISLSHNISLKDNGNETITDTDNKLMWKKCSEGRSGNNCDLGTIKKYKWEYSVVNFKLKSFVGYNDWRLPSIEELRLLIDCNNGVSIVIALDEKCDGKDGEQKKYSRPTINTKYFPNTDEGRYWSTTSYRTDSAWVVSFFDGSDSALNKKELRRIRLVRKIK